MAADPELVGGTNRPAAVMLKSVLPAMGIMLVFAVVWTLLIGQVKRWLTKTERNARSENQKGSSRKAK